MMYNAYNYHIIPNFIRHHNTSTIPVYAMQVEFHIFFVYICNDCVPACVVGLGDHSMAGTVLYCRSTVTGCSGCQGGLVVCFSPSTVAPGWATRESSVLSRALMRADVCTKLYLLITELYGIAGVVNILLDVTFL